MTLPAYRDVDLALLLERVRSGKPAARSEMYQRVARHFPDLTDADLAKTRANGRTKIFQNVVHWGRNHLRVRGLLTIEQPGVWQTNDDARAALIDDLIQRGSTRDRSSMFIDGASSLTDLLGPHWATALRARELAAIEASEAEPADPVVIRPGLEEGPANDLPSASSPLSNEESVRREILQRLNAMDGYQFEQLVARVLDGAGLRNAQVVGRSGDEGVDILADLYSPLISARVAVQVKRHNANVGPKDISYLRDRWSRRADRLLFVTTADFTPGAREVAADQQEKQVVLVNGRHLVSVMFQHNLGVRIQPLVRFEMDEEYFAV